MERLTSKSIQEPGQIDSVLPLVELRPVKTSLLFESLWLLFRFDLIARVRGFGGIYGAIRNCLLEKRDSPVDEELVTEIHSSLQRACGYYPKTAACLQRSAVLAWMLRKRGIAAEVVIGVMKFPFKSHAWVELDGKVLNDGQRIREVYTTLDRIGTRDDRARGGEHEIGLAGKV